VSVLILLPLLCTVCSPSEWTLTCFLSFESTELKSIIPLIKCLTVRAQPHHPLDRPCAASNPRRRRIRYPRVPVSSHESLRTIVATRRRHVRQCVAGDTRRHRRAGGHQAVSPHTRTHTWLVCMSVIIITCTFLHYWLSVFGEHILIGTCVTIVAYNRNNYFTRLHTILSLKYQHFSVCEGAHFITTPSKWISHHIIFALKNNWIINKPKYFSLIKNCRKK